MNRRYNLILKKYINTKSELNGEILFNKKDLSLIMYDSFHNKWKIYKPIYLNKFNEPSFNSSIYSILEEPLNETLTVIQ